MRRSTTANLIEILVHDSDMGVATVNSLAWAELVRRGPAVAADLGRSMNSTPSVLGLLALRRIDGSAYKTIPPEARIRTLVKTLGSTTDFIDFGMPHRKWGPLSEAIVEIGSTAIPALKPFQNERKEAIVSGSETADESTRYRYRVRDYAWFLSVAARGEKISVPLSPDDRDKAIPSTD